MKIKSKKKKVLIITLSTIGSLVLILAIVIGSFFLYSHFYNVKKGNEKESNDTGLIMQGKKDGDKRSLYDKNGEQIILKGVNAGNILLQEGWMSPFALEPKKNEDGSFVKDKDNNLKYPEFSQEQFLNAIKNNPNLKDKEDELLNLYYKSFFSENDFKIIKNELHFNAIRLPFYWRNILNDDLSRKSEEDAFSYLDWFLTQCKENDLYLILDLHGAPGSQNGYEHSGLILDKASLWSNKNYLNATIDLWDYVSLHYTKTKPELGQYIATYDLLNEPQVEKDTPEPASCFDFQDKIYKKIRANGDKHLITFEGVWDFSVSPDPEKYGWENIMYEYHHYNWKKNMVSMDSFKAYHDLKHIGSDYDVPIYIGEFTYFEDKDNWKAALVDWYDDRHYNWTIWNYKATVTGWWTTSWGVYTVQLNVDTSKEETKCNVATCTEEEFKASCEKCKTENCATGTLYDVIKEYHESW